MCLFVRLKTEGDSVSETFRFFFPLEYLAMGAFRNAMVAVVVVVVVVICMFAAIGAL